MRHLRKAHDRLRSLWGRSDAFGTIGGSALLFALLVISLGTPALAHADVGDLVSKIADSSLGLIFRGIAYIILAFSSFILYLVGWLFDLVVNYTVFGFGTYFSVSSGMLAAWSILRDIANIALIFGFVMIGIAFMLDVHGYELDKTLPRLIIFAVLLNFSLLASEAVIDTSNVFASVLYSKSGAGASCTGSVEDCAKQGATISGRMLQMTGIFTVYSTDNSLEVPNESASNTTQGMISLGLSIFVTIAAVVFLAGAIMLVIRAVVLSFLMVLSPIGFAGLALPPLEKYAHMWWDKLLSQSFFAPIYILLIVISIAIGEGITTAIGGNLSFAQALGTDGGGYIQILLVFAVMIGFLIASLIVAKQMGAMGADFAISISRRAVNGAWAGPRAISSWMGRATANYAGSKAQNAYNSVITKDNAFTKTLRFTGIDEGIAAGIAKVKNVKIEGKSHADRQHEIEHRAHEIDLIKNRQELADQTTVLANAQPGSSAAQDAQTAIDNLVKKMKQTDLETVIKQASEDQIKALGLALSPEKFRKLMDSKEVSDHNKQILQTGRYATLNSDAQSAEAGRVPGATPGQQQDGKDAAARIRQWSAQDLAASGVLNDPATATRIAREMTQSQYEDVLKRDEMSVQQKQTLRAARIAAFTGPVGEEAAANLNSKDFAKLDSSILANPNVYGRIIDQKKFGQMQLDSNLSPNERTQIGKYIQGIANNSAHAQQAAFKAYIEGTPGAKAYWNIA